MKELILKYGSVRSIPEDELTAHGLERIKNESGFILRRINDPEAGNTSLLHRTCRLYGISPEQVPDFVSQSYLKRMQIAFDEEKSPTEYADYQHLWIDYVRSWPDKPSQSLDETKAEAKRIFAERKLNWSVWTTGIGCWHVDVDEQKIQDPRSRAKAHLPEFRKAFTQFITREIARPDACLQNIADKIGIKHHNLSAVLETVESNPLLLKTVVRITHERGVRKNARLVADGEGFFHLNRIRKSLADKKKITEGVFSVGLASKSPFTILDIGNDSGCCIGIYMNGESSEFGKGMGVGTMPNIAVEPMVQMVEIKHGKDRVGSAMLFLATDKDGQVFVAINSIELRAKLAPVADKLSDAVIEWVMAYAKKVGAKYSAMGIHDYNTGCFHLDASEMDLEPFEGVAFRCHGDRIHTDIEDTGRSNLAQLSPNHWMIIGNLAKLPLVSKVQSFQDQEAELNSSFEMAFTRQDMKEIGVKLCELDYVDFSFAEDFLIGLMNNLGLDDTKKIPGFVLPHHSFSEDGPVVLTISNLRECDFYSDEYLVRVMALIPIAPDVIRPKVMRSLKCETPYFQELSLALLLMHHKGKNADKYIGFHEVMAGDKKEGDGLTLQYLQFTGTECILHRKLPPNVIAQKWLLIISNPE